MINRNHFKLIRQSDDLIYYFDRTELSKGFGFKRKDQDLWITYRDDLGWVAYDDETSSIMGRTWEIIPNRQNQKYPPEGIWVSRKGAKSYVYDLKYIDEA